MSETDWDELEEGYRRDPAAFARNLDQHEFSAESRSIWLARIKADGHGSAVQESNRNPLSFHLSLIHI